MTDDAMQRRLQYAIEWISGRPVVAMRREDWESKINLDGQPTRVESLGPPLENVMTCASSVVVAASGYSNPDPGITVARLDPKDAPFIWNRDQYTAIQTLTQHEDYALFVKAANVPDSRELQAALEHYVFIVKWKAQEVPEHWAKEIPQIILDARKLSE